VEDWQTGRPSIHARGEGGAGDWLELAAEASGDAFGEVRLARAEIAAQREDFAARVTLPPASREAKVSSGLLVITLENDRSHPLVPMTAKLPTTSRVLS